MKIEDCIESLNRFRELNKLRGYYVLQRYKNAHPQFKVYKTITYNLYLIIDSSKEIILTSTISDRITDSNIEQIERELNISFVLELLKLVQNGI